MIKEAATPANLRKKKIVEAVREMNLAEEPYAANFGITMNNKMAQFDGTIDYYLYSSAQVLISLMFFVGYRTHLGAMRPVQKCDWSKRPCSFHHVKHLSEA